MLLDYHLVCITTIDATTYLHRPRIQQNLNLSSSDNLIWKRCLGGIWDETAYSIQPTVDGGYIVAGSTHSKDEDVSGIHRNKECQDYCNPCPADFWVLKLSSSGGWGGWRKCLGGTDDDVAYSIQNTTDGGYIVAGYTESNDGDVKGLHGGKDFWAVKLDSSGNLVWQKCLGGTKDDVAHSIQRTKDGGYIVAGYTESNNGDVRGNHGGYDYWIVKLDASGNLTWQRCLGGSADDKARSIRQTADGGYVVAGYTYSNNGNVSGNHGSSDYWVVKLDASGNLTWQRCLGGSRQDEAYDIQQTADGWYIVAGGTDSNNGNVRDNHGNWDFWVVRLDASGNLVWQRCLGGSNWEKAYSIQETDDGVYIIAGGTHSDDGDVSNNHGQEDYWIVKLVWIDCVLNAPDQVCPNSTGNVASTAESGAEYIWTIGNGTITSSDNTQSITFTLEHPGLLA